MQTITSSGLQMGLLMARNAGFLAAVTCLVGALVYRLMQKPRARPALMAAGAFAAVAVLSSVMLTFVESPARAAARPVSSTPDHFRDETVLGIELRAPKGWQLVFDERARTLRAERKKSDAAIDAVVDVYSMATGGGTIDAAVAEIRAGFASRSGVCKDAGQGVLGALAYRALDCNVRGAPSRLVLVERGASKFTGLHCIAADGDFDTCNPVLDAVRWVSSE